jgi:hypothetical protein
MQLAGSRPLESAGSGAPECSNWRTGLGVSSRFCAPKRKKLRVSGLRWVPAHLRRLRSLWACSTGESGHTSGVSVAPHAVTPISTAMPMPPTARRCRHQRSRPEDPPSSPSLRRYHAFLTASRKMTPVWGSEWPAMMPASVSGIAAAAGSSTITGVRRENRRESRRESRRHSRPAERRRPHRDRTGRGQGCR